MTFPDGTSDTYTANIIVESIFAQVDDEGHEFLLMRKIVEHKKDGTAMARDDMFVCSPNGQMRGCITTKGWKLLVKWKDGSASWEPLRNLKELNPVEVAGYTIMNKIAEEPAFSWWVKDVIRKRDRILSKVKSRYWSRTHKYGVQLPKTVEDALWIHHKTGTNSWKMAIEKEMKNVLVAFEPWDDNRVPPGFKEMRCHMVFDVKMDLTRKARLVTGGHMTDLPKDMTYSSVVSRDSVHIFFLLAVLNDMDIVAVNIQNAYLMANSNRKELVLSRFGIWKELRSPGDQCLGTTD